MNGFCFKALKNPIHFFCLAAIFFAGWRFSKQTFGQSLEFRSAEAAKLLNEAIDDFGQIEQSRQNEHDRLDEALVRLLIANGQVEDAESFVLTRDNNNNSIGQIVVGRMDALADEIELGISKSRVRSRVKEIKRIGTVEAFKLHGLYAPMQKLLELGETEAVKELVEVMPGEVEGYSFKHAGELEYGKTRILGAIASKELDDGNRSAAKSILDRLGVDSTRDHAIMGGIESRLITRNVDNETIEELFGMVKSDEVKFWSSLKIGFHYFKNKDVDNTFRYAQLMSKSHDGADEGTRFYLSKLLLCTAQLQISAGESPDWAIDRIQEIAIDQGDQACLAAIKVLAGRTEEVLKSPKQTLAAITFLLVLENKYLQFPALLHLSSEQKIDEAIRLARKIEHPWLRAKALCMIALKITPLKSDYFRLSGLTEKTMSVKDHGRSLELTMEAFQTIKEKAEPVEISEDEFLDDSEVLERIANLFAANGDLKKAMEALLLISDEPAPNKRTFGRKGALSKKETAISRIGSWISQSDKPFKENGGRGAIHFLHQLKQFEFLITRTVFGEFTSEFSRIGNWKKAEEAFLLPREFYGEKLYVPYEFGRELAKSGNVERLRHWNSLCSKATRSSLLFSIASHFESSRTYPNREYLIELSSMVEQSESEGSTIRPEIRRVLIIGYSIDKMQDEADEQFEKIVSDKSGDSNLYALASSAVASGLPDLAVRATKSVKTPNLINDPLRTLRRTKTNREFQPKEFRDPKWINSQPVRARVALKMRWAEELTELEK